MQKKSLWFVSTIFIFCSCVVGVSIAKHIRVVIFTSLESIDFFYVHVVVICCMSSWTVFCIWNWMCHWSEFGSTVGDQSKEYKKRKFQFAIIRGATKMKFSACPWGKPRLRSTRPEFILTCPDFFLLCAISSLLWMTKANRLLVSSKYCRVKSLNVYILESRAQLYMLGGQVARETCLPRTRTLLSWASGQGFCRALFQ